MKGEIIKKIMVILLSGVILMYLFSRISFADTTPIDFNTLENIGGASSTTNESTNKVANNTNNVVNSAKNNAIKNTSVLPATGSNNEIIFATGLTILIGTTIYIYKKTRIF